MTHQDLLARYDQTRASLLTACTPESMLAHVATLRMIQQQFPGEDFLHSRCETLLGRDPKSQESVI